MAFVQPNSTNPAIVPRKEARHAACRVAVKARRARPSRQNDSEAISSRRGTIPFVDSSLALTAGRRLIMGRGILLWLLGVPIPIIILLALFYH